MDMGAASMTWVKRLISGEYGQAHLLREVVSLSGVGKASTGSLSSEELLALVEKVPSAWLSPLTTQIELMDEALKQTGGLLGYLSRSRRLLEESKNNVNTFQDFVPSIPSGEILKTESDEFVSMEDIGLANIKDLALVLVAGGLGERLGYTDIKINLPTETVTGCQYIRLYSEYIIAMQNYVIYGDSAGECRAVSMGDENTNGVIENGVSHSREPPHTDFKIPLAIMTSDDTHLRTVETFERNNYFGLSKDQVTFVKQFKVPALMNTAGEMAFKNVTSKGGDVIGIEIETKPHGHGDVHTLLKQHGLIDKWDKEGRKWIAFFQDTNALVFRGLPAALGVSVHRHFAMNSIAVARKPGDASGAICKLTNTKTSQVLTMNVEYNVLEPLLRADGGKGDVPDPDTGNSLYPGNINSLVFNLQYYRKLLNETGGQVPEFVNPKYKDSTRTTFKSPTRIECMMQEIARLIPPSENVGFTQMDDWLCFSPVKNSIADAQIKAKSGNKPESAYSAECDFYINNCKLLAMAHRYKFKQSKITGGMIYLAQIGLTSFGDNLRSFSGIEYKNSPKIVLKPSFGLGRREMAKRIAANSRLIITDKSTLVLDGNVELCGLDLDGALSLTAVPGAKLIARDLSVANAGGDFQAIEGKDHDDSIKIRGYTYTGAENTHKFCAGDTKDAKGQVAVLVATGKV